MRAVRIDLPAICDSTVCANPCSRSCVHGHSPALSLVHRYGKGGCEKAESFAIMVSGL